VGYPGVKQPPTARGKEMKRQLTAIIEREGNGYVALCPELDIASQGDTIEEARNNLKEALELFFESASSEEIKDRLRGEVYITQVEVAVG
jgi:predicted RNase H-like HicB family nuclease